MRRIRAQMAQNESDRKMLDLLNRAERLVVEALELVANAERKERNPERKPRYRKVVSDLTRLARSFDTVRLLESVFPMEPEKKPEGATEGRVSNQKAATPPIVQTKVKRTARKLERDGISLGEIEEWEAPENRDE